MVLGRTIPAITLFAALGAGIASGSPTGAERLSYHNGRTHISTGAGAAGFTGNGRLHVGGERPERETTPIEYSPPPIVSNYLSCGHLASVGCGCHRGGAEWPWSGLGYAYRDDYRGPLVGAPATLPQGTVDPNLGLGVQQATAPEPPPGPEALMLAKDYAAAARALDRQVADEPGNMVAARLLAVALLGAGQAERSAGTLMVAMNHAPQLASVPLDADAFAPGELRRLTVQASQRASADDDASFWVLAAVLMQADDRLEGAGRAIDRAEAAGLSGPVLEAFRAALPGAAVAARP